MKYPSINHADNTRGRSPRGECGLKSTDLRAVNNWCWSLPSRGVWIEIAYVAKSGMTEKVAPLAGSVD